MATREANPRKDKNVKTFLVRNSGYFTKVLGEPEWNGNYMTFSSSGFPFNDLRMRCYVDEKFLAKIYGSVLEAKFTTGVSGPDWIRAEIIYSGFVKKGKPHFRVPKSQSNQSKAGPLLCDLLNSQEDILNACWMLDLEFLRVFFDPQEQVWKILLRPYGGSLVWVMIPPMKYNVVLPRGHAEAILSITTKIARLIQGRYLN